MYWLKHQGWWQISLRWFTLSKIYSLQKFCKFITETGVINCKTNPILMAYMIKDKPIGHDLHVQYKDNYQVRIATMCLKKVFVLCCYKCRASHLKDQTYVYITDTTRSLWLIITNHYFHFIGYLKLNTCDIIFVLI